MRRISIIAGALMLGLLAGCGGGGGGGTDATGGGSAGTVVAAMDKYVGTWAACVANGSGTGSHQETVTIAKATDSSGTFSMTRVDYAAAGCSGTVTSTSSESGTVSITGTKTIGSDTVDEGIVTQGTSPAEKQVFLVKGTSPVTFTNGVGAADGGSVDANGYPNTLDNSFMTKQTSTGATGGTGGTTAALADKYVGSWVGACIANGSGTGSHRESVVIAKSGDTSVTYSNSRQDYAAAGCTGTATTNTGNGTVVFTGSKAIGADMVDEGVATDGSNPPEKQVFLVKGSAPVTFTLGITASDGGAVDANGYPNTLDSHPFTKQ